MNKMGSPARHETSKRYALAGVEIDAPKLAPGLYVVATPIGITIATRKKLGRNCSARSPKTRRWR